MNKFILAFILTALSPSPAKALEAAETAPKYQNFEQTNEKNDQLDKLLEIPEVRAVYDKCNELKTQGKSIELSECLWYGSEENGITGIDKTDSIKEKISSKLSKLDDGNKKKYESVNVLPLAKKVTESQKKLEDFYYKTMKEKIFGDVVGEKKADGTYQVIDHSLFNNIYQNQLTKNILSAISSFCIEAKVEGSGNSAFPIMSKDESERQDTRKENIKNLSIKTVSVGDTEVSGAQEQSRKWQQCFINAQYVCHGGKKRWKNEESGEFDEVTAASALGADKTCDDEKDDREKAKCKKRKTDFAYTKTRACELTNYLKVSKQNLKAVEKISEGYAEVAKTGLGVAATGSEFKDENLIKNESLRDKVDDITAVTSNEFINESDFSKGVSDDIADLEKCIIKDPEADNGYTLAPGAEESCKKYLNTNREEVDEIKTEYALRLKGLTDKVKEINPEEEDTKGLEGFLKDQGYEDEEIGQTIEANTDIKALKAQIIARYENEKLELIKSMNAKMESVASVGSGVIDTSEGSKDVDKLIRVHEELSSKTEQYAQLIHFNNVVSGFLDIKDDKGRERRNTTSIQREIANSAFSEKNLEKTPEMAKTYANQTEDIEASLKANKVDLSEKVEADEDGAMLGVDKINEAILNYDIDSNK